MASMTPRERICAAVRGQDVDYLPCSIYFNPNLRVGSLDCSRFADRVSLSMELGVDPFIGFGLPRSMHPDVRTEVWRETVAGEDFPILWQAWDTSDGRLTQAVKMDPACAAWQRIHWGDESASSMHKPLIESPDDVARFEHVFRPASDADVDRWRERHGDILDLASDHDVPLVATYGQGLAALMFTMGAQNAVMFAVEHPEAFDRLAGIIHEVEMRGIELAARAGAHILKRFGGYETCNFYSPDIYERVCVPRLRREVAHAHSLGLPVFYRVVTGMEPLLEQIAGIGFDCIEGGEPHLSRCSLETWHDAFAPHASSWTGVSTPVLLGASDPDAVRREVRHCVDVFGRRGFILGATNSIRQHFPWENTLAMVDEWKKVR